MDPKGDKSFSFRTALDVVATIALVVASGVLVWNVLRPRPAEGAREGNARQRAEIPLPAEPIDLTGVVLKGNADAPVGLVEFSEFQCPFCSRFATETLPGLTTKYVDTGQVLVGFRHLPLETIHPYARDAALIATCAASQGRFWNVHDAFFKGPAASSSTEFRRRALVAGLDQIELDRCLKLPETEQKVRSDIELAQALSLRSTPVFLVGPVQRGRLRVRKVIQGAKPLAEFDKVLAEILGQKLP